MLESTLWAVRNISSTSTHSLVFINTAELVNSDVFSEQLYSHSYLALKSTLPKLQDSLGHGEA